MAWGGDTLHGFWLSGVTKWADVALLDATLALVAGYDFTEWSSRVTVCSTIWLIIHRCLP